MNTKDKRPPTSISYTLTKSGVCNNNDKDKRSPAYQGAKFDARGFCIYHEDIRMCRVISDGKFNIVRKICYRCGSSSLVRDKKKTKKSHAQKMKKKHAHPHEEVMIKLVSTRTTRDRDSGRVNSSEVQCPNHRQDQQTTIKCSKERRRKTVTVTHTTSPVQKNAPVLPRRPLSSSEIMRPKLITAEKIDELRNMMPLPLYRASSKEPTRKKETQLPFDKHGCCRLHPTRKLAEKNQDGGWNIVAGVCPDCCVNAVLQLDLASKHALVPTKKSNLKKNDSDKEEELIGKVVRVCDNESQHTYPTANSSTSVASYYSGSNLSSPDSVTKPSLAFFTFAGLRLTDDVDDVEQTLNTSGLSEATHLHKNRLPDPPPLPLYQG